MGLKRCGDCKKQFTVRIGTIFEESKLPSAPVASGDPPHRVQQEGHQLPSAHAHPGHDLPHGLVPLAPHPRVHALWRLAPFGRAAAR
jgi:hypothetical protein